MRKAANDNRTPEFDARLLALLPKIKNMAGRYRKNRDDKDDLVNDTIAHCLHHWNAYRENGNFLAWVSWQMRGVASDQHIAASRRPNIAYDTDLASGIDVTVGENAEAHADLSLAVSVMSGRPGAMLMRMAQGENAVEIGRDYGVCRERVRQITDKERTRVAKRLGMVA